MAGRSVWLRPGHVHRRRRHVQRRHGGARHHRQQRDVQQRRRRAWNDAQSDRIRLLQTVNGDAHQSGTHPGHCSERYSCRTVQLFGLTGVSMAFTNKAALTSMVVERVSGNHPNADAFTATGEHWIVTPSGAFSGSLTLPHAITPATAASVCRYTGSGTTWNCIASSSTANTVTRAGITSGGTFAVGNNAPPPGPEPEPTIFTRYLAEGATGSFFDTTIALLNPTTESGGDDAEVPEAGRDGGDAHAERSGADARDGESRVAGRARRRVDRDSDRGDAANRRRSHDEMGRERLRLARARRASRRRSRSGISRRARRPGASISTT